MSDQLKVFSQAFVIPQEEIELLHKAETAAKAGLYNNAYDIYYHILKKNPDSVPTLLNLGVLFNICNQPMDAEPKFKRAVELAPNNPLVRNFNALFLLGLGELKMGWEELHWRKHLSNKSTHEHLFNCPTWMGQEMEKDTHVVVYTEQGKGDEILLSTMLPDLMKHTGLISLVCSKEMVPVFKRSFPNLMIYPREEASNVLLPEYVAGMSDLGAVFRSDFNEFPLSSKVLVADDATSKSVKKDWLGEDKKPIIGLAWKSSGSLIPESKNTQLKDWGRVLTNKGFKFVSLQYGDHHDEVADVERRFGVNIIEEGGIDFVNDPEKLITMVNACDLVMSVSSTPVHVAGALGKPVWNVTPEGMTKIWYWFQVRNDSPWYPTMKLFRNYAGSRTLDTMAAYLEEVQYRHGFQ